MNINDLEFLRCPDCLSELVPETATETRGNEYSGSLQCSNCKHEFIQKESIPYLVIEESISERDLKFSKQADDYSSYYELAVKIMGLFLLMWEPSQRKRYIKHLKIKKGSTVLDICTGPGNNLKYLKKFVGNTGKLVAMDLSAKMVEKCKKNTRRYQTPVSIQRANALDLPYKDEFFDVVICSGGINLFGNKKRAIEEMLRVAKEQALIVIADEGLKPGKEETKKGKKLIKMNNLYTMKPPLELLPKGLEYELEYIYKDTFFLVKFRKPKTS